MPALCSTVGTLEKLARDDKSSLSILGRSVMHDNALTARILRVVNSAIYSKGNTQITTVSRAAVILGFDCLRNICITAKLLSSLLENKNLSPKVYERLLKLMAQAFQAAVLAKMMLYEHDEEVQEQVFIAALLHHLGESAFWSSGGELTEQLDAELNKLIHVKDQHALIRKRLGTTFSQLSLGIAKNWGLGEVLIKSLTNPLEKTPETQSIFIANQLSEVLTQTEQDPERFEALIAQASEMLGVDAKKFRKKVIRCASATHKLVDAYDAKALGNYLPTEDSLKRISESEEDEKAQEADKLVRQNDASIELKKLKQLTRFTVAKTDFNLIITTALEGILDGVGVDRCGIWLVSPCRKKLQPRIVLGDDVETMKREFSVSLTELNNVFKQCLVKRENIWVNDPNSKTWRAKLGDYHRELVSPKGFVLCPLVVSDKVIGVYYADRVTTLRKFDDESFDSISHFAQLANVCLSVSTR